MRFTFRDSPDAVNLCQSKQGVRFVVEAVTRLPVASLP